MSITVSPTDLTTNVSAETRSQHLASRDSAPTVAAAIMPPCVLAIAFAVALDSSAPKLFRSREEREYYIAAIKRNRTLDNSVLTISVEHGILAAAALTAFVGFLLYAGLRMRRKKTTRWQAGLASSLTLILIVSAIQALEYDLHPWLHLRGCNEIACKIPLALSPPIFVENRLNTARIRPLFASMDDEITARNCTTYFVTDPKYTFRDGDGDISTLNIENNKK